MPTAEATQRWERDTIGPEMWPSQSCVSKELEEEIKHAKSLLNFKDDWDGEGSPTYSAGTLDRAVAFLSTHSAKGHDLCSSYPPAPKIGPGPDGSIDLHWKQKTWELLVNIPADDKQMAVFYGDDYGTAKIKGSFDPKTVNLGIINWLMH
jgi:hypothetical protein